MRNFISFIIGIVLFIPVTFSQKPYISVPIMVLEPAAAGLRVMAKAPEYAQTDVHHSLYLPLNWQLGRKYLVIL